jgi:hypothetical protein
MGARSRKQGPGPKFKTQISTRWAVGDLVALTLFSFWSTVFSRQWTLEQVLWNQSPDLSDPVIEPDSGSTERDVIPAGRWGPAEAGS